MLRYSHAEIATILHVFIDYEIGFLYVSSQD